MCKQIKREDTCLAQVNIRPMELSDVEAVSRIEAACFSQAWSAKGFRESLERGSSFFLVAECAGDILGMCGMTEAAGEADIHNVAVKTEERGRGIAFLLMQEMLQQGQKRGISDYTLEVRVSNTAAIRLYEKCGFVSEGIRPRFYSEPVEDAMIMWRRK